MRTLFIGMVLAGAATASESAASLQQLAKDFETEDSLAQKMAEAKFEQRVPPGERTRVLEELWSFADKWPRRDVVRTHILGYSRRLDPWDDRINRIFDSASRDRNARLRFAAVSLRLERGTASHEEVVKFLDDPSEQTRDQVLGVIASWPESSDIFREYIRKHGKEKAHANTVRRARSVLDYRSKHPPEKRP